LVAAWAGLVGSSVIALGSIVALIGILAWVFGTSLTWLRKR
jgi:hypothetical protein